MRGASSAVQTALAADNVGIVIFVEMLFDSGAVRVCTAGYNFTWNGFTWLGLGQLGEIQPLEESEGSEIIGLKFTISGVDPAYLSLALQEAYQGRTVNVYVGFLNLPNYTIIADPVLEWSGQMDQMIIVDGADGTATVTVTAENELYDFSRSRQLSYSHEDQIRLFPGDTGLEYAASLEKQPIIWPSADFFKQ